MTIPGSIMPLLLRSAAPTEYQISRSVRFNSSDSAYLSKNFASAGNRKTWTWAGWVKRSGLGANGYLLEAGASDTASARFLIRFSSDNTLLVTRGQNADRITSQVFRDVSAWCHLVVAVDTTQATANDRIKIYFNGTQITTFSSTSNPAQNDDLGVNAAAIHAIGRSNIDAGDYFNGYLADIHFIDGQALTPSSFTETDATTGQLIPKAYTGSYNVGAGAVNGFHLPFSDNSTAAALGTDTSGNSNTWTVNNISVGFPETQNYSTTTTGTAPTPYSSSIYFSAFDGDTSTSFFWTTGTWAMDWTSLPSSVTVSSSLRVFCYPRLGTLTVNINGSNVASITGNSPDWRTISFTGTINTISFTGTDTYAGVYAIEVDSAILIDSRANSVNDSLVDTPTSYGTDTGAGGEVRGNYCTLNPLKGGSPTNGNLEQQNSSPINFGTIGVASGKWYFETVVTTQTSGGIKIGVAQQSATGELGDTATAWAILAQSNVNNGQAINNGSLTSSYTTFAQGDVVNCAFDLNSGKIWWGKNGTWLNSGNPAAGTNAIYSNLSGTLFPAATANQGGYLTWNFGQRPFAYAAPSGFKALCDTNLPAPVVAQPSTVMDVKLYTGNGSTQTISGLGFSPDLVWLKGRTNSGNHGLYDTVRGVSKQLVSNDTAAETTNPGVFAFNSDGFDVGPAFSQSSNAWVAWTWDAGTTTASNPDGSITSTVRANPSAGFSIVTFTGPASAGFGSVGHGLNSKPKFILCKDRSNARNWSVYHESVVTTDYKAFILNSTSAVFDSGTPTWDVSEINSTIFTPYFRDDFGASYNANNVAYCFSPVAGYSSFGSYVGNGSSDGVFVYTGFRPRWIMIKNSSAAAGWYMFDEQRSTYNLATQLITANTSSAEYTDTDVQIDILSNGFKLRSAGGQCNGSSYVMVYAAFAESPFQYSRAR